MFKVGDIIIGTEDNWYSITHRGAECVVLALCEDDVTDEIENKYFVNWDKEDGDILVVPNKNEYGECFWVDPSYFYLKVNKKNNLDWR